MKNAFKLLVLGVAMIALPSLLSAQPVDVDNRTGCDFVVKVNETFSPTGCPMGTGPVAVCAAGAVTTIVAAPPAGYQVVAYGVNPSGSTPPPAIVGRPGCFPGIVTVGGWCGTGVTLEYKGRLLIIR